MYITTIAWNETTEKLPKKSGNYLVMKANGYITELNYSKKHKLFNARDEVTKAEAEKFAIDCKYWAEIPELPETESEGV